MDLSKDFIHIGYGTKAFGLDGLFVFKMFNEMPNYDIPAKVFLLPKSKKVSSKFSADDFLNGTLEELHFRPKNVLGRISVEESGNLDEEGSQNFLGIDELEEVLPFSLYISKSQLAVLPKDEYYYYELRGLDVFAKDDSGAEVLVGKVEDVYEMAHGLNLIINLCAEGKRRWPEMMSEGKLEIPFKDHFITNIDLEKNKLLMTLSEFC